MMLRHIHAAVDASSKTPLSPMSDGRHAMPLRHLPPRHISRRYRFHAFRCLRHRCPSPSRRTRRFVLAPGSIQAPDILSARFSPFTASSFFTPLFSLLFLLATLTPPASPPTILAHACPVRPRSRRPRGRCRRGDSRACWGRPAETESERCHRSREGLTRPHNEAYQPPLRLLHAAQRFSRGLTAAIWAG